MSERKRTAAELAEATPAGRDRYVDLLRALAACLVVLGHWLAIMVTYADGRLSGQHILSVVPWTHPLTWVFQVMGIFFVVGGYANTASWDGARSRGEGYASWVRGRAARLLRPSTVFVIVGTIVAAAARLTGVDPDLVRQGAWLAAIAVWFLAVYVVIVAFVPAMVAAHRRWGLTVVVVLSTVAAGFDALRLGTGVGEVGVANFLLVWLAIHQLGILWRDGVLTRSALGPWLIFAGGFAALVALTTVGPYPMSMVAEPDAQIHNTSPPTVALLALTLAQTGLALVVAPIARRWLQRRWLWTGVIALNGMIMTLFLWHMVAALFAALALYPTGLMPQPELGSGTWWALRIPWLLGCVLAMAVLVVVFARFERPSSRDSHRGREGGSRVVSRPGALAAVPDPVWIWVGTVASCAGIFQLTLAGFEGGGPAGVPLVALLTYGAGLLAFAAVSRSR